MNPLIEKREQSMREECFLTEETWECIDGFDRIAAKQFIREFYETNGDWMISNISTGWGITKLTMHRKNASKLCRYLRMTFEIEVTINGDKFIIQ